MYNRLAKDVLFTLSSTIINTVIGFVSSIIIAVLLGPEQQGILKVILMLPIILYTFLNFGIESAIVYFGSTQKNFKSIGSIINKFAVFFMAAAVVAGIAAVWVGSVYLNYYKAIPYAYLVSILLLAPVSFYQSMLSALLRAENNFVRYNQVNLAKQLAYIIIVLLVLVCKDIWVVIIANYLMNIAGIIVSKIGIRHINTGAAKPYVRKLIKFGLKSFASNVINFFNYRFDILLLTPLVTMTQLGIYSIAQTLSEMIWMIPNSVSIALMPRIAAMSEEERRATSLRVCRYVSAIMLFVVVCGYFAVELILPIVFRNKYNGSILPFKILLVGTFFMTYGRILASTIAAYGKPEKNIGANIAGSLINVLLNIVLIPRYGIIGAAISGSISYSAAGFATIIIFIRMNHGSVRLADILIMNKGDALALVRVAKRKYLALRRKSAG